MKTLLVAGVSALLAGAIAIPNAAASHRSAPHRSFVRFGRSMRPPAMRRPPQAPPLLDLAGRVLLPDGSPAAAATLTVAWTSRTDQVLFTGVEADAQGRFRKVEKLVAIPGGAVCVTAFIPGRGSDSAQMALGAKRLAHLTLRLRPGVTLRGRLLRAGGQPAAGADIHVETLFPAADASSMAAPQQPMFFGGAARGGLPAQAPYDSLSRLFPDGVAPKLFHTRTDARGGFALVGLPAGCSALLRTGDGLTLAPRSMAPLTLNAGDVQDVGTLVAVRTGGASVRILDAATGRPANGVGVAIVPVSGIVVGPVYYRGKAPFCAESAFAVDANGVVDARDLVPGAYTVEVEGRSRQITVREGEVARTEFSMRQGPLKGRLIDTAGRPVANADIVMNGRQTDARESQPPQMVDGLVDTSLDREVAGWGRRPVARTFADGTFSLGNFPWGARRVTLRATVGNDRAELTCAPSAIGDQVVLRLRPNALVTVTGRLVDTKRRPVSSFVCQALHWQSTPRSEWFASAHTLRADRFGRFRVEGLERGESFSIISAGLPGGPRRIPMQVVEQEAGPVRSVAAASTSPLRAFESPRFVAARESKVQDLGDVMVHPSTSPDEVMQSYGAARVEVASSGVLEAPGAQAVERAQQSLRRYRQAMLAGDVATVQRLTSRLSPDYAADRAEFLLRAALTSPGTAAEAEETATPMRFLPRSLIESLTGARPRGRFQVQSMVTVQAEPQRLEDVSRSEPIDAAGPVSPESATDPFSSSAIAAAGPAVSAWVALCATRRGGPAIAGILHREDGEWRVLAGAARDVPLAQLSGFLDGGPPPLATEKARASALPIDRLLAARETGRGFLADWAENRPAAMLRQTSPLSFSVAHSVAEYQALQERRPDQGICPLNPGDVIALEPVARLTVWEQSLLARLARSHGMVAPAFAGQSVQLFPDAGFPDGTARLGNLALLEYSAPSGRFLMALVHEKNGWKVVEPAMPM